MRDVYPNFIESQESPLRYNILIVFAYVHVHALVTCFLEGGCLYIVMDYCEGGDLFKKINSQKGAPFSEEQVSDGIFKAPINDKHILVSSVLLVVLLHYFIPWLVLVITVPLGLHSSLDFPRSWTGLFRFAWRSNTSTTGKSSTGTSNPRCIS